MEVKKVTYAGADLEYFQRIGAGDEVERALSI